jgi:hypothetical protein
MAWFTEAYTRPDGSAPVWGDTDDARALPFGGQHINDHRYLLGWIGEAFGDEELAQRFSGDLAECVWLLGPSVTRTLIARPKPTKPPRSILFREGGYAVLRNGGDHVFIDCGPVGTAGRGGHGHNDILSFELCLSNQHLIVDCGAYVYTADYAARNAFRSTGYHSTPKIDGQEINRFISPDDLWWLHYDARPEVLAFDADVRQASLIAAHSGYCRLEQRVTPKRTFALDHERHVLTIVDDFEGSGDHQFEVPLHLAHGVIVERNGTTLLLRAGAAKFTVEARDAALWDLSIEETRISPSYGKAVPGTRLIWRRSGPVAPLEVRVTPAQ